MFVSASLQTLPISSKTFIWGCLTSAWVVGSSSAICHRDCRSCSPFDNFAFIAVSFHIRIWSLINQCICKPESLMNIIFTFCSFVCNIHHGLAQNSILYFSITQRWHAMFLVGKISETLTLHPLPSILGQIDYQWELHCLHPDLFHPLLHHHHDFGS